MNIRRNLKKLLATILCATVSISFYTYKFDEPVDVEAKTLQRACRSPPFWSDS